MFQVTIFKFFLLCALYSFPSLYTSDGNWLSVKGLDSYNYMKLSSKDRERVKLVIAAGEKYRFLSETSKGFQRSMGTMYGNARFEPFLDKSTVLADNLGRYACMISTGTADSRQDDRLKMSILKDEKELRDVVKSGLQEAAAEKNECMKLFYNFYLNQMPKQLF